MASTAGAQINGARTLGRRHIAPRVVRPPTSAWSSAGMSHTPANVSRTAHSAGDPCEPREHVPALQPVVVDLLAVGGTRFVDATVGAGGHAAALLDAVPGAQLLGLDADPQAVELAERRLASQSHRVRLVQGNFCDLTTAVRACGWEMADGILLDLGLSSMQLADDSRGFSFQSSGPLDLRFDRASSRPTAADLVSQLDADALARIIWEYGEERWSRRIARAVVAELSPNGGWTAQEFAEVVASAVPGHGAKRRLHPATRTFQALRIAVNDELGALEAVLPQAVRLLDTDGRLAVISYHSLEDRLVKRAFRKAAGACSCPAGLPVCACGAQADVRLVTRRVIRPTATEIRENPRSRSARLRVVERLQVATETDPGPNEAKLTAH